jgi:rhodanese-related sulfurtransferase
MMKNMTKLQHIGIVFGIIILGLILIETWNQKEAISVSNSQTQQFGDITPKEAHTLIQKYQNDPDFVILDVRTPGEFAQGHLENAVNIDYYSKTFRDKLGELDRQKAYLVYCRTGNRSGRTLQIMKKQNFRKVYNMTGGIVQWNAQKLLIVK